VERDYASPEKTLLKAVHLDLAVETVSVREYLEVLVVEKQVKQDMIDNVYSLVDFPIVQEEEDQHYCRERDQRKGLLLATVERGSTARLGKVLIP
jgi:hypothetical protein